MWITTKDHADWTSRMGAVFPRVGAAFPRVGRQKNMQLPTEATCLRLTKIQYLIDPQYPL